jgi:hypothetical protein
LDKEKQERKEHLEEKLIDLEDRINRERPEEETRFRVIFFYIPII